MQTETLSLPDMWNAVSVDTLCKLLGDNGTLKFVITAAPLTSNSRPLREFKVSATSAVLRA
jgi:hypothetical protein